MPTISIDACSLLNLLATGKELEIAQAHGLDLVTTELARGEANYLVGPDDEDGKSTRIPADYSSLNGAKALTVIPMDDLATDIFVEAAGHFSDADASVVALAVSRQTRLWTDDGLVRRLAPIVFPGLEVVSTLAMLKEAFELLSTPDAEQTEIARALQVRGNYDPPRRDPLAAWYARLLR